MKPAPKNVVIRNPGKGGDAVGGIAVPMGWDVARFFPGRDDEDPPAPAGASA